MKTLAYLAILASMGLLTGCAVVGTQEVTEKANRELPMKASDFMNLTTTNGNISVTQWDGATMKAEIELKARSTTRESAKSLLNGIKIVSESEDGKVRLKAILPQSVPGSSTSASFEVKVPRGWFGGIDAGTVNGNIAASGFAGDANLLTTNGNIDISGWNGKIKANTTNGNVSGTDLSGQGYCEFGTTNGNLAVKLARRPEAGISLITNNGNATLRMPKGSGADLDISVNNGNASVTGFADGNTFNSKGSINASVNGGGPGIHVSTNNGTAMVNGY